MLRKPNQGNAVCYLCFKAIFKILHLYIVYVMKRFAWEGNVRSTLQACSWAANPLKTHYGSQALATSPILRGPKTRVLSLRLQTNSRSDLPWASVYLVVMSRYFQGDANWKIFSSSKLATKFKGIRVLIFFFYEFHTQILLYGQLCI